MNFEVELKFRIRDRRALVASLEPLKATPSEPVDQCDLYFNHPSRDFAVTDEALRIRSSGEENRLTYKGPLIDAQTKTRQELEIGCESGAGGRERLKQMLLALSFREVRSVVKRRIPYHLQWQGRDVEVTIDEVDGLGTFVELETLADEPNWPSARDCLLALAARLPLSDSERRSYLQLLLEQGS